MKNIAIGILVLVVAALGWYIYSKQGGQKGAQETMFSASFMCSDRTSFIAEFTAADELNVVVDGNVVRTLARAQGDGQRFENAEYVYVFAGEEATVTQKATQKVATCTQPFDANNAPVNFGDAGEGGGVKQDVALIVSESIVGKWQSLDDAKFVREFKTGKAVADSYEGKTVSSGSWIAFTKASAPSVAFPLEEGAVYLQLVMTGTQADTLNFKLTKLTPEELELIYLDRGGALRFKLVR